MSMRRLGIVGTVGLFGALGAAGGCSDDNNTTTTADAPLAVDAKPAVDAAAPDSAVATYSGTIALHSVALLNPATGEVASPRFGQFVISFDPSGPTIEHKSDPQGTLMTPCSASSVNVADIPSGINEGDVTFTITHTGGGAGPTVPTCSYQAATKSYQCGTTALPDVVIDGDSVAIGFHPTDAKFTAYNKTVGAGANPTLTAATKTALSSPIDLGATGLTIAINEDVNLPTALVVVIDATNATNSGATDLGTNATKTANLTCAVALANTMTIPGDLLAILKNIAPTKLRISIFHDGSDLGLLGTNLSVVVGQGLIEFTAPK
jgi:hypothetical protein